MLKTILRANAIVRFNVSEFHREETRSRCRKTLLSQNHWFFSDFARHAWRFESKFIIKNTGRWIGYCSFGRFRLHYNPRVSRSTKWTIGAAPTTVYIALSLRHAIQTLFLNGSSLQITVPESEAWYAREWLVAEHICCQISENNDGQTVGNVWHPHKQAIKRLGHLQLGTRQQANAKRLRKWNYGHVSSSREKRFEGETLANARPMNKRNECNH